MPIIRYSSILAFLSAILLSCTNTEYEYLQQPYNDIKLFSFASSTGDTTKALIKGDTIKVLWHPDAELPETITPTIFLSETATIHPASGQEIPFKNNTQYTVTAEDGSIRTYQLKIVLAVPVPVITTVANTIAWMNTTRLNITGEYFLADAEPTDISVYMQRVADGIEIPLELIPNNVTNFNIQANLPVFSAEQDTGLHRLFVKTGNRVAKSVDIRFFKPPIINTTYTSSLEEMGSPIHTNDSLTINFNFTDNYEGKIANYYRNTVNTVLLYTTNYDVISVPASHIRITPTGLRLKLPDISSHKGKSVFQYRITFNNVLPGFEESSNYSLRANIAQETIIEN